MNCPSKCTGLQPIPVNGGEILHCKMCKGAWIPWDLILAATNCPSLLDESPFNEERIPTSKLCPREGTLLLESTHMEVLVDQCPTCNGLWLDRGELGKIRRGVASMNRMLLDGSNDPSTMVEDELFARTTNDQPGEVKVKTPRPPPFNPDRRKEAQPSNPEGLDPVDVLFGVIGMLISGFLESD